MNITLEQVKDFWIKNFSYIEMPDDNYLQEFINNNKNYTLNVFMNYLLDKVLSEGNHEVVE